jgi:ribosome biogenesis GTPase
MTAAAQHGVVANGTGGVWRVIADDGKTYDAALRGRLKITGRGKRDAGAGRGDSRPASREPLPAIKLAVGDRVRLERDTREHAWVITEILPRKSRLARRAPGGGKGERVLAANLDQVIIMFAAAKPEPHPRMLDRFLVIAEANDLAARIIINKVELVGERDVRERFADYEKAGYDVHFTSVKQQVGLDAVARELSGKVSVVSGPSGVGKSSLLNALFPGLGLRVDEISESVNKGKHTTVGAYLHLLPEHIGGAVVDTPGLREIGMWELPVEELDLCFPEFRSLREKCRFADCSHQAEPDCAVRAAVRELRVSPARFDSYLKLRSELEAEQTEWT